VKKCVIALWISGLALVSIHLLPDLTSSRWFPVCGLLVCYSLPFFALTIIPIPRGRSPRRYILLTSFALVLAISLYTAAFPFLPGYRPRALEILVYLFLPFLELWLIALLFAAGIVSEILFHKNAKL